MLKGAQRILTPLPLTNYWLTDPKIFPSISTSLFAIRTGVLPFCSRSCNPHDRPVGPACYAGIRVQPRGGKCLREDWGQKASNVDIPNSVHVRVCCTRAVHKETELFFFKFNALLTNLIILVSYKVLPPLHS